jgi:hypothetical protein
MSLILGEWPAIVGKNKEVMAALRRFLSSIQQQRDF